jgi:hypothetical protein
MMAHIQKTEGKASITWFESTWKNGKICFLEPVRPGWELAKAIAEHPEATAVVLENHGVVLNTDDESILEKWNLFERQFCEKFNLHFPEMASDLQAKLETPTPIKVYFPDTAVFYDRLLLALEEKKNGFIFNSESSKSDPNLAELWLATTILYNVCPGLSEVPASIRNSIASLPVEKNRLKSIDGKG